jgi:uncharacterized membrane protein
VPAVEAGVAITLVLWPALGGFAALVLLLVFTAVIVRSLRSGIHAPCACFGAHRSSTLSPWDVLRNGMLMALAAVATATVRPVRPDGLTVGVVAAIAAVAAIALRLVRHRTAARP